MRLVIISIIGLVCAGCRRTPTSFPATAPPTGASATQACPIEAFAATGDRATQDGWLADALRTAAAGVDSKPDPTTRDLMNAALVALALDRDGAARIDRCART